MVRPYLSLVSDVLSELFAGRLHRVGVLFVQGSFVFGGHRVVGGVRDDRVVRLFGLDRRGAAVVGERGVGVLVEEGVPARLAVRQALVALLRRGRVEGVAVLVHDCRGYRIAVF